MTAALVLAFIKRAWPYLLGAALLAAGWWWFQAQLEDARQQGRAEVLAEWDAAIAANARAAEQANRENQTRKNAQNEAVSTARDTRAQSAQRDQAALSGLAAERDRLHRALDIALNTIRRCDVPAAPADAAADRTAAVESVLDSMAREAEELARAADSHAADSLMYQRAWPRR